MRIEVRRPTTKELEQAANWPIWQKKISEFSWKYAEKETCLILEGSAEVTAADGQKAIFCSGDWVVFPAGLECVWKIKEPIKKKYNFGK